MTGNLADRRRKSSDKSSLTEKDSNLFTSQDTDSSRDLACALFTDESLIVLEDDEFTTSAVEKHAVCGIAEMPYKAPLNDSKEDQVMETEQSVELVLVDDVVGMTSDLSLEDSPSYYSPGTPTDVDEQSEGDSVARIAEASDSVEDVQDSVRVSPTAMCKQDQLDGEEVEGDAGSPDRAQASSVEVKEQQAHALVKDGVPVLVTASGRVVESESTSEQAHTQAEEEEMKDEKEIEVGSTIAVNRLD